MSDSEEPKRPRPNAKYKLSKENVGPEDIVFHYNRETRLANSSRAVQSLYDDQPVQPRGMTRFARIFKPRTMTYLSVVMCCILFIIASFIITTGKGNNLDGNQLLIEALKSDDVIMVTLQKKQSRSFLSRSSQSYTGTVDITVLPAQNQGAAVFLHKVVFTRERQEQYRFVLPFDADELLFVFQAGPKPLSVTVIPE